MCVCVWGRVYGSWKVSTSGPSRLRSLSTPSGPLHKGSNSSSPRTTVVVSTGGEDLSGDTDETGCNWSETKH